MDQQLAQLIADMDRLLTQKDTTIPPIINALHRLEVRRIYVVVQATKVLHGLSNGHADARLHAARPSLEKLASLARAGTARRGYFLLALGWRRRVRPHSVLYDINPY